jgi:iron complex outermembrane receptor protein
MNAAHHGDRVADTLSRVSTPARTILDAGVRHRFAIGDTPALLRSLVTT